MAFEGILTNGVTELLNKLVPVVAQEISLAWGVKDELRKLQNTLEMILAVVADAERRQVTEEAVRLWLRWLKEVAYDADDVMEEFSYETSRRGQRGERLKHKVLDFVSPFSNPLAFRFKMANKIKNINQRLDEITKDMDRFQLKIVSSSTGDAHGEISGRRSRQTTSFASQSQIIGRDDDKNKLIKILTTLSTSSSTSTSLSNSDHRIPTVSIVGMGGLGKTTLAQMVYNNDSVSKLFEKKIWVCVSDDFDVYRILSDMMESMTNEKFSDLSNFDVLVRKVREQLIGKRYLLVLDDLWNEDAEQWERLKSSLIVGAQGSKILITTRKRQVADVVMGSISPYFLEKLQADECWSIMERIAFSPGGALKTPNMTNIGKEIANKCSGLPLAAKFLGSLMHSKNKESNWLSIRENDMWSTSESQNKIIPILKLSYDNLSPRLQRCFSYCSIFPKDFELSKHTIVELWMAEGFLQPSNMRNGCSLEDIGDEYFETLMWSSFFDGVKKNVLDDVMTFKMHDLVHDLAQAVVGDHECSTVKVTDQMKINSEVRRLNLIMDERLSPTFYKTIRNINKLRTLVVFEPNYQLNLYRLVTSKHLRVLYLGYLAKDITGITYRTSRFRKLRYFHISFLDLIRTLRGDASLRKLYNLQTLVLTRCGVVQHLVNEMGSLKHLRHLDISFTDIQELPDSLTSLHKLQRLDLNHCKNFTTFPDSVTGLEFLRFLDLSFTPIEKIPDSVTSLCHLQTLDVNTCKKLKTLPENMASLKNLSFFDFKDCPLLEALPIDFGALYELRSLDLSGTAIKVLPDCSNLSNLEYVHLGGCELPKEVKNWIKLRKFHYWKKGTPTGIGKLVWVQKLTYRVREQVINELECNDSIEELGNLNFLEVLAILNLENVKDPIDAERANLKGKHNLHQLILGWGEEIEEQSGMIIWDQKSCNFQVFEALQPPSGLRELHIRNFMGSELPNWMYGTLLNLEILCFINCRGITKLQVAIGQLPRIKSLSLSGLSLKSLDINGFPSLMALYVTDIFLLEEFPYSHPCLQELGIVGCKRLKEFPSFPCLTILVLQKINHELVCTVGRSQKSLTYLSLENVEDLIYFPISILQNNSNLQTLKIEKCNQIQGFQVTDDENENESSKFYTRSLQKLILSDCPDLKFLPDLRGWTSLQKLTIFKCPQVKESLTYDLRSLSFLKQLYVDYIERDEQRGDPSNIDDLINLMRK